MRAIGTGVGVLGTCRSDDVIGATQHVRPLLNAGMVLSHVLRVDQEGVRQSASAQQAVSGEAAVQSTVLTRGKDAVALHGSLGRGWIGVGVSVSPGNSTMCGQIGVFS